MLNQCGKEKSSSATKFYGQNDPSPLLKYIIRFSSLPSYFIYQGNVILQPHCADFLLHFAKKKKKKNPTKL